MQAGHGDFKIIPAGSETIARIETCSSWLSFPHSQASAGNPTLSRISNCFHSIESFPSHAQCPHLSCLKIGTKKPQSSIPHNSLLFMCFLSQTKSKNKLPAQAVSASSLTLSSEIYSRLGPGRPVIPKHATSPSLQEPALPCSFSGDLSA